jgi:beta-1,4-mannosyl-glycoprotein beta-1,4-N-acetylglucosaminyltransferase
MIFSHELDMLEAHMAELDSVVDRFVIMESDVTYSGQPKPLYFKENRQRFAKWEGKLSYQTFTGSRTEEFSYKPGDFTLETQQRNAMTQFLNSLRVPAGTLVLVADVDEIPYTETMRMIKLCELPAILHLELIPFVYSFEFASGDMGSWHVQVHTWNPGVSFYKHSSKSTEDYVTEAGVHCR